MTFSKLIPVLCVLGVGAMGFAAQAEDNPAQAAARMALAKQLFEINGTNAPLANPAQVAPPVATKADKAAAAAKAEQDAAQVSQKSDADRAALSAALAERTNAEAQAKPVAVTKAAGSDQPSRAEKKKKKEKPVTATAPSAPASKKGMAVDNTYAGQDIGMKQIAAPALPISSSKAERLQSLLDKYKADQITPDEYHQQRAAILAEP